MLIDDFPNYEIFPDGQVINQKTRRPLKPFLNKTNGYLYVSLWKNNKGKNVLLHRLLAEHFIPQIPGKSYVNHKDGVKTNTCVDNLEWVTFSENMQHAYDLKLVGRCRKMSTKQLSEALQEFFSGISMTALADAYAIGLTRLSINLRKYARVHNLEERLDEELRLQKQLRMERINGIECF